MAARVFLGLGSNLAAPESQLKQAFDALASLPDSQVLAHSSLYFSKPLGPQDQPDYVNAAVLLSTSLSPTALLDACQSLEQQQGRERLRHWGERTLDIDILLYDELELTSERLILPHPQAHLRDFVLLPLQELQADLVLHNQGLTHWLGQCPSFVYHSRKLD